MNENLSKKGFQNFTTAMYVRSLEINPLGDDITPFTEKFEELNKHVHLSKVYLEAHRDLVVPNESTLIALREYLNNRGIEASAGITVTIDENDDYKTYCYSNPIYRQKLIEVVQICARLFDEIIFDDFFFTNCKCPMCIEAKGKKSWTNFRLEQMAQASTELVLEPARAANPNVKVIIKYPNWYEHFQGLGFNLKDQPPLYDGIYTGNETRDSIRNPQHLQPYESYLVSRYYENIKPGGNKGGWVDTWAIQYLDRYAEQLWLTLFAKAPELTLFDFSSIQLPIEEGHRGPWQGQGNSFDFDAVTAPIRLADGSLPTDSTKAIVSGSVLRDVDKILGYLGNPVGVKAYKPYHSNGEDFLHNYLGMCGIPMDLVPEFPAEAGTILLTEAAKFDTEIVEKIQTQLMNGKNVVITAGLLHALKDKGIKDIVEMERTDRKITTNEYMIGWDEFYTGAKPIVLPAVDFFTNDTWEVINCVSGAAGASLMYSSRYAGSKLFVLNIPDNFDDLYNVPAGVLTCIKEIITKDLYVRVEAPAHVTLFVYDNDTFIVESFLDETGDVNVILDQKYSQFTDLQSGETMNCEKLSREDAKLTKYGASVSVKPHSFRIFKAVK